MTSYTRPSIYVGTYHKYNCGSIYGAWIDVLDYDDKAEFYAHCSTLHADEVDPELMFQDWEGFPSGNSSVTVTVSAVSKYDDYRIEIRHADTQQLIWRAWDFEKDFLTDLQCELANYSRE